MNTLQAGFSRVDITPMLGIGMAGYYVPRFADGVLDPLQINALALSCGDEKVVLMSVDHCGIVKEVLNPMIDRVCEATGLPREAVYIHSTHTHTGPFLNYNPTDPLKLQSYGSFGDRICPNGEAEVCGCRTAGTCRLKASQDGLWHRRCS